MHRGDHPSVSTKLRAAGKKSMAPPSHSPDTSISSHTLSIGSANPPPMELQQTAAHTALLANPTDFLVPTAQLNASFLAEAKKYLDPVAASISESQTQRQQYLRKRKRGGDWEDDAVLRLRKLHVAGFGVNQVFEQSRKIIEAAAQEIELSLPNEEQDGLVPVIDDDGALDDAEELEDESSLGEEGVDFVVDGEDDDAEAIYDEQEDSDVEMEDGEGMFSDEGDDNEPAEIYQPDPNGLNDGFFSIDNFNKTTEFLENQDQRGEAAGSDDDEIDWEADPMTDGPVAGEAYGAPRDASDEDEGGPTFGNVDLDAPDGYSDEDDDDLEDGLDDGMHSNNVMYQDFFAPPAQKASKATKTRVKFAGEDPEEQEENIEAVTAKVHRDLFEDNDSEDDLGDLSDVDPAEPKARRSTHERRQAKIAEEIRKLEAANVAKREWQVSRAVRITFET
jgi:U3 small nucleolar RNA-associated protein MPP10